MANELEKIYVSGYKSIRELEIELRPLNVLIGANGSGKSNFISLFQLLNQIFQERLQSYSGAIGADSLLYYGRKTTSVIEIELTFRTAKPDLYNGYAIELLPSQEETLIFGKESVSIHDRSRYEHPLKDTIGEGHRETELFDISRAFHYRVTVDYVIDALKEWKLYHFHDTSASSKIKQTQNIDDNQRLQPDASNIAAFLYLLQEKYPRNYKRIRQMVRRVVPFFDDFVLSPSPLNPDKIRLLWRDVNSENVFNPHTLSDGTLRFMCLTTLLMQPDDMLPSVILIDEPELGLHPHAINLLVGMLQSASTKSQVIISTQSVPLVNQFAFEDIIVVDRKDGQSTFERLEPDKLQDWMTEYSGYGLGDLWEKNVFGGQPQIESI